MAQAEKLHYGNAIYGSVFSGNFLQFFSPKGAEPLFSAARQLAATLAIPFGFPNSTLTRRTEPSIQAANHSS
jgi:hypothetical protein